MRKRSVDVIPSATRIRLVMRLIWLAHGNVVKINLWQWHGGLLDTNVLILCSIVYYFFLTYLQRLEGSPTVQGRLFCILTVIWSLRGERKSSIFIILRICCWEGWDLKVSETVRCPASKHSEDKEPISSIFFRDTLDKDVQISQLQSLI